MERMTCRGLRITLEQFGEVQVLPGAAQRVLVVGLECLPVLGSSASRMAAAAASGSSGCPLRGCSSKDHDAVTGSP
jgi:hypothetical protein